MNFREMQMNILEKAYKDMHNAACDAMRSAAELSTGRGGASAIAEFAAIAMNFNAKSDRVETLIKIIKEFDESENKN